MPRFDLTAPLPKVREIQAPTEPEPETGPVEYAAQTPTQASTLSENPAAAVQPNTAPVLPGAWFDWAHQTTLTPVLFLAIVRDPIPELDNLKPLLALNMSQRLDLMNLLAPKLRPLGQEKLESLFLEHKTLIAEDGVITPLELAAHRLLKGKLNPAASNFVRQPKWTPVIGTLLAYLAYQWPSDQRAKVYIGWVNRLRGVLPTESILILPDYPKPDSVLASLSAFEHAPAKVKDAFAAAVKAQLDDRPLLRQGLGLLG